MYSITPRTSCKNPVPANYCCTAKYKTTFKKCNAVIVIHYTQNRWHDTTLLFFHSNQLPDGTTLAHCS
jgi:hypothetical protein